MLKPEALAPKPSMLLAILGGLVGTILLSSLIFLAPVLGFPFVDVPQLVGGVFSANPDAAFWIGFWLYFLTGIFLFAPLLAYFWPSLPGRNVGFVGAALKGITWGALLWAASGLLFFLMGLLNRVEGLENPGLFALNLGILAAVGILLAHLAYGLAVALLIAMGQGIKPLDTMGWDGIGKADLREVILRREGREVPDEAIGRRVP